jgi:hypothetical protein
MKASELIKQQREQRKNKQLQRELKKRNNENPKQLVIEAIAEMMQKIDDNQIYVKDFPKLFLLFRHCFLMQVISRNTNWQIISLKELNSIKTKLQNILLKVISQSGVKENGSYRHDNPEQKINLVKTTRETLSNFAAKILLIVVELCNKHTLFNQRVNDTYLHQLTQEADDCFTIVTSLKFPELLKIHRFS